MPRARLAVAIIVLWAITLSACRRDPAPPPGNIAARLAIATRAEPVFDPAALAGKPAIVVFWRPGCPHCRDELPLAQRAAADTGATAVAVQISEGKAFGTKVLAQLGWTGVDLFDDGALRRALEVKKVPWTLVLRSDGTAARAFIGGQSYGTLKSALASVE